ncbi:unnamed protein product, partial [Gulo gulo]
QAAAPQTLSRRSAHLLAADSVPSTPLLAREESERKSRSAVLKETGLNSEGTEERMLGSQHKGFLPFLSSTTSSGHRMKWGLFESCHQTKAIFQLSASSDPADQGESLHRPGSWDLLFLLDQEFNLQSQGIPRKGLYEHPPLGSASI